MKISAHAKSQVVFYLGWLGMIFAETTIWSLTGLVVGFFAFLFGGWAWGLWHIKRTTEGVNIHGPVLVLMDRMLAWNRSLLLIPAALLGGGPGVALVLKKQAYERAALYGFFASFVYAAVWCVLHAVRPSAGVPVEIWPSAEFLQNIWNLF